MRLSETYKELFPPQGKLAAVSIAGRYKSDWLVIDHDGYIATSTPDPSVAACRVLPKGGTPMGA